MSGKERRDIELLAPAGGPGQLNAALAAGADALYCGFGNTFNARRGAENFTSATFGEACRRAHLAGARVYVTTNVVIRDVELAPVLGLVRRAWLLGADAFIVQDWGLLHEIHERWPEIECHVSTQANVHDVRGALWSQEQGARRVTVSRELSLPELAELAQAGVEVECFCHGAICVCYSGVCHMSSCAGERSANRGACAQPCRLPYELVDDKGRVLSPPDRGRPLCPKDFYSFEDLPALVGTGVTSLKIEGRLKGPEYLASVVAAYRAQLDDVLLGRTPAPEELALRRRLLKRVFNRDFTNAYLQGTSGDELMSYERSNNRGELVGEVVESRSFGKVKVRRGGKGGGRERLRTVGVAEVDIRFDQDVSEGDLLEVRPVSDPTQFLTTTAPRDVSVGELATCRTVRAQEPGSVVRVIRSRAAMDQGAAFAEREVPRKRPVAVRVRALKGQAFCVELNTTDGVACARATGFVVEAARTRAVTKEDLRAHVGRMGGTPFEPASFEIVLDEGCGMAYSAVHAVRADACKRLEEALLAPYARRTLEDVRRMPEPSPNEPREPSELQVCAVVTSPRAARAARKAGATRVYASSDALGEGEWPAWVIPCLDEVCRSQDGARLDAWVQKGKPVAVGNVSELVQAARVGAHPEIRTCLPVHNRSCRNALVHAGAQAIWLSPELSLEDVRGVALGARATLGLVVLGRPRAMTTEHCVLQVANRCVHNCAKCDLRAQRLALRSQKGDLFPVRTNVHGRSRVYAAHPLDLTPHLGELAEAGITWFAADCSLLSPEQTTRAVGRVCAALKTALAKSAVPERLAGHVTGHLFAPIA